MQNLLLLHGAIGSSEQLLPLKNVLADSYNVFVLDFPGHGGKELPDEFSIPLFADSVIDFMKENNITSTNIFGYSMGGYVGMYLAKYQPKLVQKVITLATKFYWDEDVAAKETKMLQPEVIEQKVPAFAGILKQRHAPQDWKLVLQRTAEMLLSLGKKNCLQLDDYTTIEASCLVLLGDKDKMVTLEETEAVYKQLGIGRMEILENTPHPIKQVNIQQLTEKIINHIGT